MSDIKQQYIDQYTEYHSIPDHYPGLDIIVRGHNEITHLVEAYKPKSLLDYGCGKGYQYTERNIHEPWGMMPTLYDPGVPEFSTLPDGPFDGIYSTDVMEHIPEEALPEVLTWIFENANQFVFLGICTRPAYAVLPNGDNAHCTVKSLEWWSQMVEEYNKKGVKTHLKCYGDSNGYNIFFQKNRKSLILNEIFFQKGVDIPSSPAILCLLIEKREMFL